MILLILAIIARMIAYGEVIGKFNTYLMWYKYKQWCDDTVLSFPLTSFISTLHNLCFVAYLNPVAKTNIVFGSAHMLWRVTKHFVTIRKYKAILTNIIIDYLPRKFDLASKWKEVFLVYLSSPILSLVVYIKAICVSPLDT